MKTIDFRKEPLYAAETEPAIVTVPEMLFVMVDGKGAPESTNGQTEFQEAMQILFGIVYTIKFWDKKHSPPKDYAKFSLTPLEGLWWTASGHGFDTAKPDDWRWTVMIRLPGFVTPQYFQEVVAELVEKKQTGVYKKARLELFNEGTCVQLMHIGPYDQEQANIEKMHAYALENGYTLRGKHHELYFSDPRRTKPEKLRTILRHPVQRAVK